MITADTHIIIWDALKPQLLSEKAQIKIKQANESGGIIFCDISLWEIAMLMQKKRLEIDLSYLDFINLIKASNKYVFQSITPEIADLSTKLSYEVDLDPADRIIAATSIIANAPLITADKNLRISNEVNTIW